jgi:hypothetical protein
MDSYDDDDDHHHHHHHHHVAPAAAATTNNGGLADDHMEALEQQLIQHLRTSGVRQQREVELINEVMAIRRERRKSFAAVRTLATQLEEDNRNVRARCTALLREREAEAASRKAAVATALHKKEAELHAAHRQHEQELLALKEKFGLASHTQIARITKVYEEKLRAVDAKLQELEAAKHGHDQRAAQAIAAELADKAVAEATAQHRAKLQQYKDAVRSIVEKERDATQALAQVEGRLRDAEQDKRVIGDRLRQTEEQLARAVEKGRALHASTSTLQHAVDAAQAQLAAARADLAAQRTMHEDALAQLRDAHAAELEEVDAKVRKALQGRDDKIRQLADQVIRAERAQTQAEQVLAEINAGITATRRPASGRR